MASTGGSESVWGELSGYLTYSAALSAGPILLLLLLFLAGRVLSSPWCFRHCWKAYKWYQPLQERVTGALLLVAYFLCLPASLAVARLLPCNTSGLLSADPTVTCGSFAHMLALWIAHNQFNCSLSPVFSLIPPPLLLHHHLRAAAIYSLPQDHERHLQVLELERILGLTSSCKVPHLWLTSSFRLHSAGHRWQMLLYKLLLLLVYIGMRSSARTQAVVFWVVVSTWTGWTLWYQPYRCPSTGALYTAVHLSLWMTTYIGMLTGYGVRISLLVASKQAVLLAGINILLLGLGVVQMVCKRGKWPTLATLGKTGSAVRESFVKDISEVKQLVLDCRTLPPELVPIHAIEELMPRVRAHWLRAKQNDSIFEGPLHEALDDLSHCYETYVSTSVPEVVLMHESGELKEALRQRRVQRMLLNQKRRAVLNKLLAVAGFLQHTKLKEPRPAQLEHLVEETKEALLPHAAAEVSRWHHLRTLTTRWKNVIRDWEEGFEARNCRPPLPEEKEEREEWYSYYGALSERLHSLGDHSAAPKA
ncbi:unnamed protein product [Chrysoparadoxa australica]